LDEGAQAALAPSVVISRSSSKLRANRFLEVARLGVFEESERAMKLYDLLQFSVCLFSILAAGFWLRSATTTLPNLTENLRWDGTSHFQTR
jgi:hypothetical protein